VDTGQREHYRRHSLLAWALAVAGTALAQRAVGQTPPEGTSPSEPPPSANDASTYPPITKRDGKPTAHHTLLVVPRECDKQAGGGNNNIPFSWTPSSYLALMDPTLFEFDGVLLLSGIRFRLSPSNAKSSASGEVDIEVALSTKDMELAKASATFADNIGDDRVVVLQRTKFRVEAADRDGEDSLKVWDLRLGFDRFYKYRTNRVLVLEIKVFGNDQGSKHFQFPLDAAIDPRMVRVYGMADKPSGNVQHKFGLVTAFEVAASAGAPAAGHKPPPAAEDARK
jgi:hypothetical protein